MQWISEVKASAKLLSILPTLELQQGRARSFGPCPSCSATKRSSEDHRFACGVTRDGRAWRCHRCQEKGDILDLVAWVRLGHGCGNVTGGEWADLRKWCVENDLCQPVTEGGSTRPKASTVGDMVGKLMGSPRREREKAREAPPTPKDYGTGPFAWRPGLAEECEDRLWESSDGSGVREYLASRGFEPKHCQEFGLGVMLIRSGGRPVAQYLTIPLRNERAEVVNIRFRAVPGQCLECEGKGCTRCGSTGEVQMKPKYRVCRGRPLPLFSSERLPNDLAATIIVTEGELDVIALHQFGFPAGVVSGTAGAGTMRDEWLDQLEPYRHFVVAYDADEAGDLGAEQFAEKMGKDRVSRARLPHNDASSCLQEGVSPDMVERCIDRASPMFGVKIRSVPEYGASLERLISNPDELRGRRTSSTKINACLGGIRPGLMVISGDTGQGKTTWATWLCKDLADQEIPCLVTSFEQQPVGTVQKLLRMELGTDFTRVSAEERTEGLNRLGNKPIHILDHYGHLPVEKLMQTLRYAGRRLGVKLAMVDHLGFLIDPDAENERRAIEAVIRALALTGYTLGMCIGLICHPKNVRPGERVTMSDLKGASAIKQDASSVIIVQRDPPRPKAKPPRHWSGGRLYFDKVRSEFGRPGSSCLLAFGPLSCSYADDWHGTPEGNTGSMLVTP